MEATEDMATGVVETAQPEVFTAVVHKEAPLVPRDVTPGESAVTMTTAAATKADSVKSHPVVDMGLSPQQEHPVARDEGNILGEETKPAQEEAATTLLQTIGGFDPFGGQVEEPRDNQEADNITFYTRVNWIWSRRRAVEVRMYHQ